MKRKLILSIFAALLAVAMLLPLTSCEPQGSKGAETTATPTVEATTPPAEESRGALIPLCEDMLNLKASWENSDDEEYKKRYDQSLFEDWYENDHARRDGKKVENSEYLVKIFWEDEDDLDVMLYQIHNRVFEYMNKIVYFSKEEKMMVCWLTVRDMYRLAFHEKLYPIPPYPHALDFPELTDDQFPANIRFEAARGFLNSVE